MARKTKPLTATQIDKAKYSAGKNNRYYDGDGLYLAISPKGLKSWRVEYKLNDKANTYTLGRYPALSLIDARQKRKEIQALIAKGIDPKQFYDQAKQEKQALQTFGDFITVYLAKRQGEIKPATYKEEVSKLNRDVLPMIGDKPLIELTKKDIRAIAERIESRKHNDGLPPRELTRRTIDLVNRVLKAAVNDNLIAEVVSANLKDDYPKGVTHHYKHVDIFTLPRLLNDIDGYHGNEQTKLAMKFLAYTLCRTQEMRLMRWQDIDWKNKIWNVDIVTLKKNKKHIVPLSNQVIEILRTLEIFTGEYDYVFYNKSKQQPYSENFVTNALKNLGYGGMQTGHGFRHIGSMHLNELGYSSDAIELQLHHEVKQGIKGVYDHSKHLDKRFEIMQGWADFLDLVKDGKFETYKQARTQLDGDRKKLYDLGLTDEQINAVLAFKI